jgi:hypothetical protein
MPESPPLAKGFTLKGIKGDFKNLIPLNLPLEKGEDQVFYLNLHIEFLTTK